MNEWINVLWPDPYFDTPKEGAGSGEGTGGEATPPTPYRPDGLADHLHGDTDTQTIDMLMVENKGFRDKIAGLGTSVKSADEYEVTFGELTTKRTNIAADDKLLVAAKNVALDAGISKEAFEKFVPALFENAFESGIFGGDPEIDNRQQLMDLAPDGFQGTDDERLAEGSKRTLAITKFIEQLPGEDVPNGFSKAEKEMMGVLTAEAAGVKFLERLQNMDGFSVSTGGDAQGGGITEASLEARLADPRNNVRDPKFDESFAEETDKQFRQFYSE